MLRLVTGYNEDVINSCNFDMAIVPMNTSRESLCGFGTYLLSLNRELNIKSNDNPNRRIGAFTYINNNDGVTVVSPLLHDIHSRWAIRVSYREVEEQSIASINILVDLVYQAIAAGKKCIIIPTYRVGRNYVDSRLLIEAFNKHFHSVKDVTILLFFKSRSFIPPISGLVISNIPSKRNNISVPTFSDLPAFKSEPAKRIDYTGNNPYLYG